VREILWFQNDLRITDNALLHYAKQDVLPIYIFDKGILNNLDKEDRSICFLYESVLVFKKQLQSIRLDLAIFFDEPKNVFMDLKKLGFESILSSYSYDNYSKKMDETINNILPIKKFYNRFILNPNEHLKKDNTPYKVFTPFYKSLTFLTSSLRIEEFLYNKNIQKIDFDYDKVPSLEDLGFKKQRLPLHLTKSLDILLEEFILKLPEYKENRDYFSKDATSNLSVYLRYGLISARELFNVIRKEKDSDFFIRELFFREFYAYILYHFPFIQFENFKSIDISYINNQDDFAKWCEGKTGVPIIDAAMIQLNTTGLMHNRLRMVTASYLTKNLLIDWRWGERYFAKKLLDYEISTNIASWQWAASTGVDAVPYFRVFNPYIQSKKFDKEADFIKKYLPLLSKIEAVKIHKEDSNINQNIKEYPKQLVSINFSRKRAIEVFKKG